MTSVFRPDLLKDQVALITGGATGIGFGIAETLTELGAHVVLASRKPDRLSAAVDRLQGRASAETLDVRNPDAVKAVVARIVEKHKRIDLLVNNAAGNFYAPSESLSPNAWRSVVEIDLFGTFFCSQAVAPVMRAAGGGRIVNISMTLHYRGWPQMAHATAAKAGVDALTKTLAVEWAPAKIHVNAIAPGPIPTEGVRKAFAQPTGGPPVDVVMDEHARRTIPLGRWGTPADIGNMVAYLASPAGDWITGSIFVVDGGEWLARNPPQL